MATNVEALKNLYVTLGGNAADVADLDSNSEMIEALRNVAGGGGGGSSKYYEFTGEVDVTSQTPAVTFDKTYAEILAAVNSGKVPVCFVDNAALGTMLFTFVGKVGSGGDVSYLVFTSQVTSLAQGEATVYVIEVDANGTTFRGENLTTN